MHSVLNNIALQVVNGKFVSEIYTKKPNQRKGRSILIEKNNKGLIIQVKYDGKVNDALNQAKAYVIHIEGCLCTIFLGCNITKNK